jgi:hypothetical protein
VERQERHTAALSCVLLLLFFITAECTPLLLLSPGVSLVASGLGVSRHEVLHAAGGDRDTHHHHIDASLSHEVWQQQPLLVEVPVDVRWVGWGSMLFCVML